MSGDLDPGDVHLTEDLVKQICQSFRKLWEKSLLELGQRCQEASLLLNAAVHSAAPGGTFSTTGPDEQTEIESLSSKHMYVCPGWFCVFEICTEFWWQDPFKDQDLRAARVVADLCQAVSSAKSQDSTYSTESLAVEVRSRCVGF